MESITTNEPNAVEPSRLFHESKAAAALGFLLQCTGESLNSLLAMLYLSDRLHLIEHGRYIFGDEYHATETGPVPSLLYKCLNTTKECQQPCGCTNETCCVSQGNTIWCIGSPDTSELSRSELEALNKVVNTYRTCGSQKVRALSLDDAWSKAWHSPFRVAKSVHMPIADVAFLTKGGEWVAESMQDTAPGEAKLPVGFLPPPRPS